MKMLSKIGYEYEKKDNLIRKNYVHKDKTEIAQSPRQLKLPRTKVRKGNCIVRYCKACKKVYPAAVLEVTVLKRGGLSQICILEGPHLECGVSTGIGELFL